MSGEQTLIWKMDPKTGVCLIPVAFGKPLPDGKYRIMHPFEEAAIDTYNRGMTLSAALAESLGLDVDWQPHAPGNGSSQEAAGYAQVVYLVPFNGKVLWQGQGLARVVRAGFRIPALGMAEVAQWKVVLDGPTRTFTVTFPGGRDFPSLPPAPEG